MTIRDLAKLYCDSNKTCSECGYANANMICAIRAISNWDRRMFDMEASELSDAIKTLDAFEQTLKSSYLEDFRAHYPDAPLCENGIPQLCPYALYKDVLCVCGDGLDACVKCWNQKM